MAKVSEEINLTGLAVFMRLMWRQTQLHTTRSGGRGFSHYDAEKKVIRGINQGVGGVVTYHEIYQGDEAWIRTSKQILADGTTREFYSTIRFTDNNQTIQIEIWQSKDGKEGPSQTNVWRRIE